MLALLLLSLVLVGSPFLAEGAEEREGMEYLALRGAADGGEKGFNNFQPAETPEQATQTADARGYLPWKNSCIRVSRMAAGDCFEFGGESGFSTVAPYARRYGINNEQLTMYN